MQCRLHRAANFSQLAIHHASIRCRKAFDRYERYQIAEPRDDQSKLATC